MLNHVMIELRCIVERRRIAQATVVLPIGILMFDEVDVHFHGRVEIRSAEVAVVNAWRRRAA